MDNFGSKFQNCQLLRRPFRFND